MRSEPRRTLTPTAQRCGVARLLAVAVAICGLASRGCESPGRIAKLTIENEQFRRDNERLEKVVARRDATIAGQGKQIATLQRLGPDRPVALFAPVGIKIASLSGGADYDGEPGDDGVTVYVKPIDADGDVVKAPATIEIELIDHSLLGKPVVLAVYRFDDLDELRRKWHSKFLTQHYSLECPFPPKTKLPTSRRLTVTVRFHDILSGAVLQATKEVTISFPSTG